MRIPLTFAACGALLVGLLSSCLRDLDLDYHQPQTTLVVNSIVSPDEDVAVRVTQTRFFTDHSNAQEIKDAQVLLSIEGQPAQKLQWVRPFQEPLAARPHYTAPLRVKQGQQVSLSVETTDGRKATAQATMPRLVPIEKWTQSYHERERRESDGYYYGESGSDKVFEVVHEITFTDPPGERNFYFVQIVDDEGIRLTIDYSQEELFRSQLKAVDQFDASDFLQRNHGMPFSDDRIAGKTYTLRLLENRQSKGFYTIGRVKREVRLYAISEDYYHYLKQVVSHQDDFNSGLVEVGLADPPKIHSNIKGGVGILGLMQIDRKTTELKVQP